MRDLALIKVCAGASELSAITQLAEIFRGKIVDVASGSVIVEVTGDEEKIEGFVEVLRPLGIIEMVRTGVVVMARGVAPLTINCNVISNDNGSYTALTA